MRPTCAGDSGPRSERAVLRHPIGAEAIDRANRTADAQYNRQSRARSHGECHSRRRRAQGAGSHWGRLRRIGAGNSPAPIPGSLPQCPFPCPTAAPQCPFPCPTAALQCPFPCPATASPSPRQTPARGSTPMPVPVRSLNTGAGCGGATDSVLTGMPLLARRNHLAHERPSPGAAHDRPVFTALPRSARATPRGCPAQRLSFSRKTARPPPRPARSAIQNSTRRA